jgi:hypothetical protein
LKGFSSWVEREISVASALKGSSNYSGTFIHSLRSEGERKPLAAGRSRNGINRGTLMGKGKGKDFSTLDFPEERMKR